MIRAVRAICGSYAWLLVGTAASMLFAQVSLAQTSSPPPPPSVDGALAADSQSTSPDNVQDDVPDGAEIMLSGPLHEAFAEQFTSEATPGLVVDKKPPEPIDEIPPEYQPEGSNIVWVPGYWGWDLERNDFVWITGVWREAPPERVWIPGYWADADGKFQWVSGFWSESETQEIAYLPPPPEPVEALPSSEPPTENDFWIPGQWNYVDNNYQWRAGYWSTGHQDWVWVPERYIWTPRGYIYRAGYWDYLVSDRGTIFCPVYYSQPVAAGYRFRPTYVVRTGANLLANLFVYPRYNHYYFGNYYGSRMLGNNFYPWVSFSQQSRLYDPLYGYYRTQYQDYGYLQRITRLHNYYAANVNAQPPRTLAAQLQLANSTNLGAQDVQAAFRAARLQSLINNKDTDWRFVKLQNQQLQQLQNAIAPTRELRAQRAKAELDGEKVTANANANATVNINNRWKVPASDKQRIAGAVSVNNNNNNNNNNTNRNDATRERIGRNDNPNEALDPGSRSTRPDMNGDARNLPGRGDNKENANNDRPQPGRNDTRENPGNPNVAGTDRPNARGTEKPNESRDPVDGRRPPNIANRDDDRAARNPKDSTASPAPDRPYADRPNADRPGADRTNTDRPNADRPNTDRPNVDRPNADRPGANRPDGMPSRDSDRLPKPNPNNPANPLNPGAGNPSQGSPGTGTRDPLNRPNADPGARPNVPNAGGSIQDDMRAMRDLNQREQERRRSAAPGNARSLPQRPVPGNAPNANRNVSPGARPGANPGINPGANPGVRPNANPGINPGGNPGGNPGANPGRANPGRAPAGNPNPGGNPGARRAPNPGNAGQGNAKDKGK